MIAVDTSVVVAAFAPWHEDHDAAMKSMRRRPHLPAHCGLESYATLTRLPEPFRAAGGIVADYLARRFAKRWLVPPAESVRGLPAILTQAGILGGASYDGLVAFTAREHGATLHTLDRRAEATYRTLEVRYEFLRDDR
ncbi:MAG: PIN domain-containing protein [Acidimicrobiales bacterium]